jgi:hypothetical protein
MKTKLYAVISRSVLDGVEKSIKELNSNLDKPMSPTMKSVVIEATHQNVMREILEYVDFGDDE